MELQSLAAIDLGGSPAWACSAMNGHMGFGMRDCIWSALDTLNSFWEVEVLQVLNGMRIEGRKSSSAAKDIVRGVKVLS